MRSVRQRRLISRCAGVRVFVRSFLLFLAGAAVVVQIAAAHATSYLRSCSSTDRLLVVVKLLSGLFPVPILKSSQESDAQNDSTWLEYWTFENYSAHSLGALRTAIADTHLLLEAPHMHTHTCLKFSV